MYLAELECLAMQAINLTIITTCSNCVSVSVNRVSPTIDMVSFFSEQQQGRSLAVKVQDMVAIYERCRLSPSLFVYYPSSPKAKKGRARDKVHH